MRRGSQTTSIQVGHIIGHGETTPDLAPIGIRFRPARRLMLATRILDLRCSQGCLCRQRQAAARKKLQQSSPNGIHNAFR
jgi:hypothetical protein